MTVQNMNKKQLQFKKFIKAIYYDLKRLYNYMYLN